jgi:hypothetical protein
MPTLQNWPAFVLIGPVVVAILLTLVSICRMPRNPGLACSDLRPEPQWSPVQIAGVVGLGTSFLFFLVLVGAFLELLLREPIPNQY